MEDNTQLFRTMLDCLSILELHCSYLASFIMMLLDTKTIGVCTIHIGLFKIKDGDRFSIFKVLGIAS